MKILEFWKTLCYNIFGKVYEKEKKEDRNMINVLSLSNHIISLFEANEQRITNLKLQKILYYVQGYFFKKFDTEAFPEEIYCWQYGPVVPIAYYEYNIFGSRPLVSDNGYSIVLTEEESQLIDLIVSKCQKITSSVLVDQTHRELPWKNALSGQIIAKQAIKRFFAYNDPLEICE